MEKCIVVVSLAALIAVTMGQLYALIYNEIGKKQENYESKFWVKNWKTKKVMRDQGGEC
jgi:hypothetical protein